MRTLLLKPQIFLPKLTKISNPKPNPQFLIPIKTISSSKHYTATTTTTTTTRTCSSPSSVPSRITSLVRSPRPTLPKTLETEKEDVSLVSSNGYSRYVILGTITVGLVLFLMGVDDQKALALGPEGPLMEEFWDNMRRYGLYALSVSTGFAYALFEPILELLKNPISAVLILTIIGGSIFIVTQVVSAMVGFTEFNYEYSY